MVRFTLGDMVFEYDEEKTVKILRSTASPSRALPEFSLWSIRNAKQFPKRENQWRLQD